MKATEPMSAPSAENYKQWLIEARELRSKGGQSAYRRAQLLTAIFDDRDFRADLGNCDDFKADEYLADLIEDLCVTPAELRSMLQHFPSETAWQDGRLRRMLKEVEEANSRPIAKDKAWTLPVEKTKATLQNNLAQKEQEVAIIKNSFQEATKQKRAAEKRCVQIESRYISETERLQERIRTLEAENFQLRDRIHELESQLSANAAVPCKDAGPLATTQTKKQKRLVAA